jgi:hypothetical protein
LKEAGLPIKAFRKETQMNKELMLVAVLALVMVAAASVWCRLTMPVGAYFGSRGASRTAA